MKLRKLRLALQQLRYVRSNCQNYGRWYALYQAVGGCFDALDCDPPASVMDWLSLQPD